MCYSKADISTTWKRNITVLYVIIFLECFTLHDNHFLNIWNKLQHKSLIL